MELGEVSITTKGALYIITAILLLTTLSFADSNEPLVGDISGPNEVPDGRVDYWDISVLASEWLTDEPCLADICGADGNSMPDGAVNFWDCAALAKSWMFGVFIPDPYPADFIEDFSNLAEWGWTGFGASLSQDYTIVRTGNASIRLTRNGAGTPGIMKDYGPGHEKNFQYHNMLLQYYVDPNRAAQIDPCYGSICVYLYSSYSPYDYAATGSLPHAAGWNTIDLCPSQFSTFWNFDWTKVQRFLITVTAPPSGIFIVFDRFEAWPTGATNGAVMFTFDDGYLGSYTEGITYLASKGYRSVWYISGEEMRPNSYILGMKMADWPDVAEANNAGCLIATHCQQAMPVNDVNVLRTWCATQKQYLINHGYTTGADYFAIPGGQRLWNGSLTPQQMYDTSKEYFLHIRGTAPYWPNAPVPNGMGNTSPSPFRPRDVHWGWPTGMSPNISANKLAIDKAKLNRDLLVFEIHDVELGAFLGIDPNIFRATVDYVESQGLDVITYEDLLTGNFAQNTRTLAISSTDGGDVTVPGEGVYNYNHGAVVNLTASDDWHYHFVNWTGSAVDAGKVANPTSETTTVTMDDNYTVVANFAIDTETLTSSSTDGGDVTVPGEGVYDYNHGDVVDLTATADLNYHFVNWTGTAVDAGKVASPTSATTTVTMYNDYTITANFAIDRKIISGYVTDEANIPVEGADIDATNGGGSDITDFNGYYKLTVDYGWSGAVTVYKEGYIFEPNGTEYSNVTTDLSDNYIAMPD
jgi:peptidoglycan/xylan/chitin deacetylase (PgdA/CDA1 family)